MATLRNLVISLFRLNKYDNIAKARRRIKRNTFLFIDIISA